MVEESKRAVKPGRIWRSVLIISLALNMIFIGIVLSAAVSGRFGKEKQRSFDFGIGPIASALTEEERRAISRQVRDSGVQRDFNPRGDMERASVMLRADPFVPEDLLELLTGHNFRMNELQSTAQAVLVEQIVEMSPERRLQLADEIMANIDRPRPPRDQDKDR